MTRPTNAGRTAANVLSREQRFRASGVWPKWSHWCSMKPETKGWFGEMRDCAENGVFVVMWRETEVEVFGPITHAVIRTASGATDITWAEKQRIKDVLFGRERAAIEVYPRRSKLIDDANMYHLWILPQGRDFPVTLAASADEETPPAVPAAALRD